MRLAKKSPAEGRPGAIWFLSDSPEKLFFTHSVKPEF